MKTDKYISTISYNTIDFLHSKLLTMVNNKEIDFFAFIWHKGEQDPYEPDKVDKDHIHLILKPRNPLETDYLSNTLEEPDKELNKPKLGVTIWQKSKIPGTWIFYSRHDSVYLDSIGETKQYLDYPWTDFYTNDNEMFRRLRAQVKLEYKANYKTINNLASSGLSPVTIKQLINPNATQVESVNKTIAEVFNNNNIRTAVIKEQDGKQYILDRYGEICGEIQEQKLEDKKPW